MEGRVRMMYSIDADDGMRGAVRSTVLIQELIDNTVEDKTAGKKSNSKIMTIVKISIDIYLYLA
jgi:hypothetical protein